MTAGGGGSTGSATWYGKGTNGLAVPDGTYSFAVGDAGGTGARITGGQTTPWSQRRAIFPLRGTHSYGGAGSRFGAPRSGHTHQGQDVSAACGTPLVAAQGGKVMTRSYQASGAGYYIVIKGKVSKQDSVYMHMKGPGAVAVGQTVKTGDRIGRVGTTGGSSGCHLHFELWTAPGWYTGGAPYDPLPALKYWDNYS
jgi:murein DD-endopeptidase MepM/ murein hydrolase activator NlpD